MLVRKLIHERLKEYYAQPFDRVVGSITGRTTNTNASSVSFFPKTQPSPPAITIPFRYLLGESHWKYRYGQIYRQTSGQWLTPSELFSPHYGQCMARWMIPQIQQRQQKQQSLPIEIVELGGGRGTNAMDILDYCHDHFYESIYRHICSYTILDASDPLLDHQRDRCGGIGDNSSSSSSSSSNQHHRRHAHVFQNRHFDLYDYATSATATTTPSNNNNNNKHHQTVVHPLKSIRMFPLPNEPPSTDTAVASRIDQQQQSIITIVLGLEVLDNLPHDKIRVTPTTTHPAGMVVEQVELDQVVVGVVPTDPPPPPTEPHSGYYYKEVYAPLTDALLQHVLQHYPLPVVEQRQPQYFWIPTVACGTIYGILKERPNAMLLLADFDSFQKTTIMPPVSHHHAPYHDYRPALGEPIVTDMNDQDLSSYLHPPVTPTDILFPTNFPALAAYLTSISVAPTCQSTTGAHSLVDTTTARGVHQDIPHDNDNDTTTTTTTTRRGQVVTVQKQCDFLQRHGPQQVQATTSLVTGYSPMIHDFENCSILTLDSGGARHNDGKT